MTTPFPGKTYMSLRRYERDKSGGKKEGKNSESKTNERTNEQKTSD